VVGAMPERLTQVEGVLSQELDGELLLLAPGHAEALHLDAVASTIWRLLEHRPSVEELIDALTELYGVERDRVTTDLGPVLERLEEHGAVRRLT
jgi:hypothetical protein